jgi:hypothetical protein
MDELHGQTGVTPNGIELHPLLGIAIPARPRLDEVASRTLQLSMPNELPGYAFCSATPSA